MLTDIFRRRNFPRLLRAGNQAPRLERRKNLFRDAQAVLDGAVHVALPFETGVFAGKKHPLPGQRKQAARRRRKRSVEKSLAAARPGIVFPTDAA